MRTSVTTVKTIPLSVSVFAVALTLGVQLERLEESQETEPRPCLHGLPLFGQGPAHSIFGMVGKEKCDDGEMGLERR